MEFKPEIQSWFYMQKSINIIHYINKIKDTNHNISADGNKSIWQNPAPLHDKKHSKLGVQRNFFNLIKDSDKNPQLILCLVVKKMCFPWDQEKDRNHFLTLYLL